MNLDVPLAVEGVDKDLLNPSRNWGDLESYAVYEEKLVNQFKTNFEKFDVSEAIISAGPK
jgi:phosphoenolpyruvate carboxykinase (ATP)